VAWLIFISAVALMLVIEGILPFLSPESWRKMVKTIAGQSDRALRIYGLVSMLVGVALLYWMHH
jgi:uncharacterized protein YjeT (DUF2065 family)